MIKKQQQSTNTLLSTYSYNISSMCFSCEGFITTWILEMSEINNSAWLMSYHESSLDHKFKNKKEDLFVIALCII